MKFILDMGVSPRAIELLTSAGHDVVHVGQVGFATSTDQTIAEFAIRNEQIVVTFDRDFVNLLARTNSTLPSIIYFRVDRISTGRALELLRVAVERFADELNSGAVVTIKPDRLHCRMLPMHQDEKS